MLKKGLILLVALCVMLSMSGCSHLFFMLLIASGDDRASQDEILSFVRENEQELLSAVESGDFSAYQNKGFIQDISAEETVVDFSCGGAGMGSATSYVGFYYTSENDMAAVWCAPYSADALTPCGDGFEWQSGDNRYYTEHICGNFYYYEASF